MGPLKVVLPPGSAMPLFAGISHNDQSARFPDDSTCTERFAGMAKLRNTFEPDKLTPGIRKLRPFHASVSARNSAWLEKPSPSGSAPGSPSGELAEANVSNLHWS